MLEAFRELGYKVEAVVGFAKERKKAARRVKAMIRAGREFDFAYAESSTMPMLLTEPHHLPTHPLLDFGFFKYLNEQSIPIGLFYRDVYWQFPDYKQHVPGLRRFVAHTFYRYGWLRYRSLLDHLFLPTTKMLEVLPRWTGQVSALPPGCEEHEVSVPCNAPDSPLSLFYVGGVQPPFYDMRPLLEAVKGLEGVRLTLCCREQEWRKTKLFYKEVFDPQKVQLVHVHGLELVAYYRIADVFVDIRNDHTYLRYTFPLKTFEPLGYGLPSIVGYRSEAARFVEQENVGWVVEGPQEARQLLRYLQQHREAISRKRDQTLQARARHTWAARAEEAARTLLALRHGSSRETLCV